MHNTNIHEQIMNLIRMEILLFVNTPNIRKMKIEINITEPDIPFSANMWDKEFPGNEVLWSVVLFSIYEVIAN